MQVGLFYYDDFAEFEIALCCLFFRAHDLFSIALENREYRSLEKQRFLVDKTLREVDPQDIDLLIIPGGDPTKLYGNSELKEFVEKMITCGKKVSGICGGSEILASLGVLKGRRCTGDTSGIKETDDVYKYYTDTLLSDDYVVTDGNIITGQGQAYIEFAIELARQTGLYKREDEYLEDIRWFKNLR